MNSDALNSFQNVNDLVQAGIAAAKAGDRERARTLLTQVVEQNEGNAAAWLWLSGVVDSLDDREVCLENVLALDPGNDAARKGLDWVHWMRKEKETQPASPVQSPAPPMPAEPRQAEATQIKEPIQSPPASPRPEWRSAVDWDGYADEYRCPYCAARTLPEDRKCQVCGGNLWLKQRRREERSTALWILIIVQATNAFWMASVPFVLLVYAAFRVRFRDPMALLNVYLGLPNNVPPEVASAVLATVPRLLFFLLSIPCLVSLVIAVGLYMRWRPIFYLFVLNCFVEVVLAFASWSLSQGPGLITGGVSLGWAMLGFYLIFRIEDDFYLEERHVPLLLDREAKHGPALVNRGQVYVRRKMWALAAIHFRKACGLMPGRLDCRLALVAAYIKLKQYGLAATALAEARRTAPGDPQVEEVAALLDQSQVSAQAQL